MGEAGQVLSKEQSEMIPRLSKALEGFKGKQVILNTSGGIMTNELYRNFEYKFFENCEKQNLLDFQDEGNAEAPTICINLDHIHHITVDDNDEDIEIQLKDEFTIRLELQK